MLIANLCVMQNGDVRTVSLKDLANVLDTDAECISIPIKKEYSYEKPYLFSFSYGIGGVFCSNERN